MLNKQQVHDIPDTEHRTPVVISEKGKIELLMATIVQISF